MSEAVSGHSLDWPFDIRAGIQARRAPDPGEPGEQRSRRSRPRAGSWMFPAVIGA